MKKGKRVQSYCTLTENENKRMCSKELISAIVVVLLWWLLFISEVAGACMCAFASYISPLILSAGWHFFVRFFIFVRFFCLFFVPGLFTHTLRMVSCYAVGSIPCGQLTPRSPLVQPETSNCGQGTQTSKPRLRCMQLSKHIMVGLTKKDRQTDTKSSFFNIQIFHFFVHSDYIIFFVLFVCFF